MSGSLIEKLICSKDFSYLAPYFYNNPFALRCELGQGEDREAFRESARRRALEIFRILFPSGADAIVFDNWIWDLTTSGEPEEAYFDNAAEAEENMERLLAQQAFTARFIAEKLMNYRHITLRSLPGYEHSDAESDFIRRDRIVCFSDGRGFDEHALIDIQLSDDLSLDIGLVSFENECILSVYDDRGCDIVFADAEHMKKLYPRLEPYFLEYDKQEMERRLRETQQQ